MDFSVLLDIDKPFPIDEILSSHHSKEFLAILPRKWFEHYILSSYSNLNDLEKQFLMDVRRSTVYLNDRKCPTNQAFKYILSNFILPTPIMGFFTQSIFAYIFEWISQSLPDNVYLGECSNTYKKDNNFIIKTIGSSKKIQFRLKEDMLIITKWLRIFTFKTHNTETGSEVSNLSYVYFKFTIPLQEIEDDIQLEIEFYPEKNI